MWGVDRRSGQPCEVSERFNEQNGWTYFTGHWSGKPNRGFAALEQAGSWRRRAAVLPAYHANRAQLIRDVRLSIQSSRELREMHDNEFQRSEMRRAA